MPNRLKFMTIDDFYSNIELFNDPFEGKKIYCDEIKQRLNSSLIKRLIAPIYAPLSYKRLMSGKRLGEPYTKFFTEANTGVIQHENKFRDLYGLLNDDKSRRTLLCILAYRLTGNIHLYRNESDFLFKQYFDNYIVDLSKSEIFVDCGGYNGDTTEMFINLTHDFSKVYFYEPDKQNYSKAIQYLREWNDNKFDKIVFRNYGVGKTNQQLGFSDGASSGSRISDKSESKIQVVSLDSDIQDHITLIKMDIEGFEKEALEGAKRHISIEHPKLAICVYHKPDDLWEIPLLIKEYYPEYKLYLRQYGSGWWPNETVIYAI